MAACYNYKLVVRAVREQSSFFYNLSLVDGNTFFLFLGLKIDNSNNLSGAEQLFKECNGSGALFFPVSKEREPGT